jgi:chemotaxis protein histidine kinase CheA
MTTLDPTEVFRQEASELFETLEAALLDLCQRPDDRELVDSAFRALHTIKGSGAMFGSTRSRRSPMNSRPRSNWSARARSSRPRN